MWWALLRWKAFWTIPFRRQVGHNMQAFKWALLFPTFFLCSYFSLLFSENALLSLLFSPKMFEVTENCIYFPRLLCLLGVCKNQINLIWAATMQKFIKYYYFNSNSFSGTLILVFSFHCNVVLLFRENFVSFLCLFLSLKTLRTSLLSLLFMIEIPTFALLFQNLEPYFIPTFSMEGTWKPEHVSFVMLMTQFITGKWPFHLIE